MTVVSRPGALAPDTAVGTAAHALELRDITKRYGAFTAVDGVSLRVDRGQFLTLLGPSGSGKTTILMAIAGFVAPSAGAVLLDGRDITGLPPERRDFGMVFQGYALFPHMTVAENVAFPLRVRGLSRAAREEKVRAALDLVQLSRFAGRRPAQLSGGQQQRVALARALVFDPDLLLLDEPLSALDKKLRAELQEELKALHRRIGRTFVNVTHDQEEALSLSDQVAILNHGKLVQVGPPEALYERPRTRFVADFLGKSNFLHGMVREVRPDHIALQAGGTRLVQAMREGHPAPGMPALLSLRPEKIALLGEEDGAENEVTGRIAAWAYLGAGYGLTVATADLGEIRVALPAWRAPIAPREGLPVRLGWSADAAVPVLEDADGG
ncbi:ABC transporter ATP-binding protein [Paracraurococcus lichenis]|uniref:Spermidine/putrescine import ATP-binding protein PotA n=1 Tax=Paracraurococcus lichenis TaxID=3064888 RepID=A0ABT9DWM4_9PROT|nr:ABC transporter ATP-binding protein [Paracraurococcus sp. LOR1-02]MDO9708301.1 ABC transporter ATP-binding protein [Paracraurococcus sp. LOR1-02]